MKKEKKKGTHAKLKEEGKIVDSLQDRSKNLQTEKSALPSGKSPFERERQKQLLQKLKSFANALRKRKRIFTRSPSSRSSACPPPHPRATVGKWETTGASGHRGESFTGKLRGTWGGEGEGPSLWALMATVGIDALWTFCLARPGHGRVRDLGPRLGLGGWAPGCVPTQNLQ